MSQLIDESVCSLVYGVRLSLSLSLSLSLPSLSLSAVSCVSGVSLQVHFHLPRLYA